MDIAVVSAACFITLDKNKIIKDETPFYLKRIMKDFIGVKDTGIYNTLQDGRTKYNFKIFQKV